MAKQKRSKMSTGEAVTILANESKLIKTQIRDIIDAISRQDLILRDYIALFEHYIEHTKDGKSFIKKMEKVVKERINEQQANEQVDGRDTDGNSEDKGVRAEGVRAQEG